MEEGHLRQIPEEEQRLSGLIGWEVRQAEGRAHTKAWSTSSLVGNGVSPTVANMEKERVGRSCLGWVVMIFSGLVKGLRLHPAEKETHEVIRQQSDKATFAS